MDREAMIAALIFGGSGSGGGGGADAPFVIRFTKQNNTIKTDKTSTEIGDALTAGKPMIALATGDIFGGTQADVIQLELANTETSLLGMGLEFVSKVAFYGDNNYATISAYRITGQVFLGSCAWTAYTDPIYVPRATSADDGKVLGVDSNGRWGVASDKGTPFEVEFTITGQPSGISYPVSVTVSLDDIYDAVQRGDRVFASVALGGDDVALGILSGMTAKSGGGYKTVTFEIIGLDSGLVTFGHATIEDDGGGNEDAYLEIFPLSAAQMTYDSTTQTLAIVDPLA